MKHENVIAIDPDKEKSGVAFLKVKTRQLEVTNLSFPLLLEYLQHAKAKRDETGESLIVVVEAGWMNKKSCFHAAQGKQAERMSARTMKPGAKSSKCANIGESKSCHTSRC